MDVRLVDAPAGVAQEERHTVFLHLPSAMLALIFIARRIQPSLSLVDREVEFMYPRINRPSSCDCAENRTHIPACQKVSRLPSEPPGRPAL